MVGIYYSNSLISSSDDLQSLDDELKARIALLESSSLKKRLGQLSFKEGFSQRIYRPFNTRELSEIAALWRT